MNPGRATAKARLLLWLTAVISLIVPTVTQTASAQDLGAFDTGLENQLGLTFSPDGTTAFWVAWNGNWGSSEASHKVIYTSQQRQGVWSTPAPVEFSGSHSDDDPFVTPDGRWLYFVSDRPSSDDDESPDANIWRYSLVDKNHLEYVSINSASTEYSPVVSNSGALYFASDREGGQGQGDLYRAEPGGSDFLTPQPLGPAINTPAGEWNLWVSADERDIIFEASSRPTNVSTPGDLYYSWRTPAGWTHATPLGNVNTQHSDLMPRLHPDGRVLFYTTAPIGGHAQLVTRDWAPIRAQIRAGYAPALLVANRSSHEITMVDLARGEVVTRVTTGEGPHLLSNVSDARVLATGYGEFPKPHMQPVTVRPPFVEALNSRLTVINTADGTVLLDAVIEDCAKPHSSWLLGQRGYVTCETEKRVLVIDLESGQTIDHFDTRQKGSHVLSFEPETRTLAVANTESGSVTLIKLDNGDTEVVRLAAGSEGLLSIAGSIWVANATDGSISIIDPRTPTVAKHIDSVCSFPIALSQDSQNQVWIACFGSSELVAVDRDSFAVRRRISLKDQPLNLLVHPTRQLAYASYPRQNAVAEISLDTSMELRRIPVGIEPDGLRWAASDY
ncbi:MAG TPA: hypothetical protein PKK10_10275 [Woeseiaceae bacterium]|nr:hypothetical protein [Woeseiaceae bacterium]